MTPSGIEPLYSVYLTKTHSIPIKS